MRTGLNLRPGDRGTKKLVAEYGNKLVCVRYRYDKERKKRYKTIELIVEEKEWKPKSVPVKGAAIVEIGIRWQEKELRNRVKQAGGKWNPDKRTWELRYDRAIELGLEDRIKIRGRERA